MVPDIEELRKKPQVESFAGLPVAVGIARCVGDREWCARLYCRHTGKFPSRKQSTLQTVRTTPKWIG